MATVSGITVARAEEIENASVVSGHVSDGVLYLTTQGGAEITAGELAPAPYFEVIQQAPASDTTIPNAVDTTIPSLVVTTSDSSPAGAVYVVTLDVDLQSNLAPLDDAAIEVTLKTDGVGNARKLRYTQSNTGSSDLLTRSAISGTWVITGLTAGDHTFTVMVSAAISSGVDNYVKVEQEGTRLTVVGREA